MMIGSRGDVVRRNTLFSDHHLLGALTTRTPAEEKEEDISSRLMLSGITWLCLNFSPWALASTVSSWPLSLMVMSSGLYCCMLSASLYSSPSLTLRRTVASATCEAEGGT